MKLIMFISLGCDKNTVDTEFMLGLLRDKGYNLTNDEAEADVIVVNTCAFISDALEESINTILEVAEFKKTGRLKRLVVAGCLAQRFSENILKQIPEVDAVVGTTAYDKIVEAVEGTGDTFIEDINALPLPETKRVVTTGGYYSYLKIAEGCDKHCTYCIIPSFRGSYRSVPMERLVEEAKFLVEGGAKELIIVAQETTVYGIDLYGKKSLPELLTKLSEIEGLRWIRILYCYPEEINDELIAVIRDNPKVCKYLDLPIQHAADSVLKRMGRRTTTKDLTNLIKKLRKEVPDISLRTTLISGFPGETEEDHEKLVEFVTKSKFEHLGVFTYSKEQGTAAAKMDGQVHPRTKARRRNEIMKLQQKISVENTKKRIGKVLEVMVEGKLPEDGVWVGRSSYDAPNVDGFVFFKSPDSYLSGEIVNVLITESSEYDLIGEAVID